MKEGNHPCALWPVLVIVVAALAAGGCSSSTTTSGLSLVGDKGTHPADFPTIHPGFAIASVSQCTPCHGEDLKGGISNTSCFTSACHHGTKTGWVAFPPGPPQGHGAAAKSGPTGSGFVSCRICHGNDFLGGSVQVGCLSVGCHGGAGQSPHPAQWRTGDTYVHTTADPGNASVCTLCHLGGANSPIAPPPVPPAGTPPGCFNNTLCHGAGGAPHPVGSTWVTTRPAAQPHGNSAKAAPSSSSGFAFCQVCHGTGSNFAGGSSGVSCYTCHGANAPHPKPWRRTLDNTYVHTTADPGNASVCALCHLGGANSPIAPPPAPPAGTPPGCFNSTLCHSTLAAPHALGTTWILPNAAFHGLTAKQDLSFCQTCHGTTGTILFEGGVAPTKCSTCHTAAKAHPTTWFRAPVVTFPGYVSSHRNSGKINTTCTICHKVDGPGAGPNPAAPSCFSASFTNADGTAVSCHANGPVAHAVPFLAHTGVTEATYNDPFPAGCASCHAVTGTSPVSSAPLCTTCHTAGSPLTLMNCTSCHAEPPDGATATAPYPNKSGAHGKHIALNSTGSPVVCGTCHNGLGAGTQSHYDRAKTRQEPASVAFTATYNANTGGPAFNSALSSLSCSNASCHGGQTTPNWRTGAINVNTQCTSCHAYGTGQFNSFNSGRHDKHVNEERYGCGECHNTTTLAVNHFRFLSTQAMEGPASATIGGGSTRVQSYNSGTCSPTCHGSERWRD